MEYEAFSRLIAKV